MHPVRRKIEDAPPGTLFTREGLLQVWEKAGEGTEPVRWLSLMRALSIINDGAKETVTDRALRAKAARWERMMAQGKAVPIRVRRSGPSDRSPYEFYPADVWAYADKVAEPGPKLVSDRHGGTEGEERGILDEDELARRAVDAVTRNLCRSR